MQLVEEGKLSLDDTIDKYFPSYKYGKKITVKNLLTMTAGIKDYINKDGDTNTYAYNESQLEYKVSAENSAKKNKKAVMDWILDQELNLNPMRSICTQTVLIFFSVISSNRSAKPRTKNILKRIFLNRRE